MTIIKQAAVVERFREKAWPARIVTGVEQNLTGAVFDVGKPAVKNVFGFLYPIMLTSNDCSCLPLEAMRLAVLLSQ